MTLLFTAALGAALLLLLKPSKDPAARFRAAATGKSIRPPLLRLRRLFPGRSPAGRGSAGTRGPGLTLVVQQLAALLKGGRTPGRLWDELWILYSTPGESGQLIREGSAARPLLSAGSTSVLAAARTAAASGAPVSDAIRRSVSTAFPGRDREGRTWSELAACFDIAEASGCPLAEVLTRYAAQLEAEDDAEAARQTALAGPKATVRLLTWLPLMGLGLGAALGVDPLSTLLGTPMGLAALLGGVVLTAVGRAWSARLVAAAAAAGVP